MTRKQRQARDRQYGEYYTPPKFRKYNIHLGYYKPEIFSDLHPNNDPLDDEYWWLPGPTHGGVIWKGNQYVEQFYCISPPVIPQE